MRKRADYGQNEKTIANKMFFLYGLTTVKNGKTVPLVRDGKSNKVWCKHCEYDNGVQCLYDILVAHGEKPKTKHPCGKAYAIYKANAQKAGRK